MAPPGISDGVNSGGSRQPEGACGQRPGSRSRAFWSGAGDPTPCL